MRSFCRKTHVHKIPRFGFFFFFGGGGSVDFIFYGREDFSDSGQEKAPKIWRVTGRESGSPELLESPRTSPEVSRTSPEVFGDFPGSSLTVELNSNPEVPRKFPRLPRKFPGLPRKFPGLPRRSAVSLGSLTPSSDSQKLSANVVQVVFRLCLQKPWPSTE